MCIWRVYEKYVMFSIWNFDMCNINFRSLSICCLREWIRGWSINAFIQVFPPGCLLSNPINAVTTKFVRTSTNKLRCPIFCVAVSINDFVVHQYLHGRLGALLLVFLDSPTPVTLVRVLFSLVVGLVQNCLAIVGCIWLVFRQMRSNKSMFY